MLNFINNDFDPELFQQMTSGASIIERVRNGGFIRGKWTDVTAWEGTPHRSRKLWVKNFNNGITDVGIHYALDRFTNVGAPAAVTWYAGLIDNAGFTGVSDSDTSAPGGHTGWTENQDYSEAVRQTLSFGAAAARTISDSVSFSINATVAIKGLFVISESTKGGTTGTLFSTALFASVVNLTSGNTLTANYSLTD